MIKSFFLAGLSLALAAASAHSQITVDTAWARPTLPGQQSAAAYMSLRSAGAADRLLAGSTPAAERFELHSMAMAGDVMQMRQLTALDLPAGQTVELKPGGLHVMLTGLKSPLKAGLKVPITLKFEKAGDVRIEVVVASRAPGHSGHKH